MRTKTWTALAALLALSALPVAGAAQTGVRRDERPLRTVVDETGRTIHVSVEIKRVISLAPNLTEIVYALGAEDRLVAVTNQCDYPAPARSKPRVGDVLNPNIERIIELRPDVVLGTTSGNRRETVEVLERAGIPLYGVNAHSVDDIFTSLRDVAALLGIPEAGEALAARLQARLQTLTSHLQEAKAPRILFVLWLEPLLTVGSDTFLNDVIRRAGAQSVTADLSQDWPRLSLEYVIESDPDYLVLPRAYSLEDRLAQLSRQPPWEEVRAVRQDHIIWLNDAVLRPGPRIVEAIEELARALHRNELLPEAAAK